MNSFDAARLVSLFDELAFEKAMMVVHAFCGHESGWDNASGKASVIREQMRTLLTSKVKGHDND